LPDGQITKLHVQPLLQKFSDFQKPQIRHIYHRLLSLQGAFRDRHERWEEDAVDAIGALTRARIADGEVVWF
jgi:hypothetical protein